MKSSLIVIIVMIAAVLFFGYQSFAGKQDDPHMTIKKLSEKYEAATFAGGVLLVYGIRF